MAKDEMTGGLRWFALSPTVYPNSLMEFPYSDVQAWLGVGCSSKGEWSFVGFTTAPNLNNTETGSGFSYFRTRVRWDDEIIGTPFAQKWGDTFLVFENDAAIRRIVGSRSVLLELDWHGQGLVYFEFTLRGSANAIAEIREKCAQL